MKTFSVLSLVVSLSCAALSRAQIINTFPAWDGSSSVFPFGEPRVATVGQVFTVEPGFTNLAGYQFALAHFSGGDVTFASFLTAWDPVNSHPVGPVLFSSGPFTLTADTVGFVPLALPTGGLSLTAGAQYVAFLNTSLFFDGVAGAAEVAFIGSDVYAGGGLVGLDNLDDTSLLGSATWGSTSEDLAFAAVFTPEFTAVPEPSTYGLIGAGMLVLGLVVRRRRVVGIVQAA